MTIFTIGFSEKSAEHFFELLKNNGIELLVDVRLKNTSQMAGFSKKDDLNYFLKTICACKYQHMVNFAPTDKLLKGYKEKSISWEEYEKQYTALINERDIIKNFIDSIQGKIICLLCSENLPENCHRRLLSEMLAKESTTDIIKITHLK